MLEELGDGTYTVVFDGTPYRCECFGVGIRFIGPDTKVRRKEGFYGRFKRRVIKLCFGCPYVVGDGLTLDW